MVCSADQKTQELVALAQDGDVSALERLYRVYGERVRWMVRFRMGKVLRSKLESMDVVQDVLIHAFQGLGSFTYTNEGDFVRWLSKITQNSLRDNLDRLHAAKRDVRREVSLRGPESASGGGFHRAFEGLDATTPSVIVSRREDLARLEAAIDRLKPEYRDVIVLTKIEGLSYKEIGQRLGKSPDAVRMLVPRAMAELTTVFMKI